MYILTNNKKVYNEYKLDKEIKVDFIDTDFLGVLIQVRDRVHKGHMILTHPLNSSIKPNETPYKSIMMKFGDKLDFKSLSLIENAIEVTNKFLKNKIDIDIEKNRSDYELIDYTNILSAIDKTGGRYGNV